MPTVADVQNQFDRWNLTGRGPDHMRAGNWRFERSIMYYADEGNARFVNAADGRKIALCKMYRHHLPEVTPGNVRRAASVQVPDHLRWLVPTLGVNSRFEDDVLPVHELHERLHYLFLQEARMFKAEHIDTLAMPTLGEQASALIALHRKMYTRHHNWSLIFGLNWAEMPSVYLDDAVAEITRRVKAYEDPKAVAARERAKARAIAKKALGLS